jgi:ubiquinone biosynthesis monooxygenase Coq7
MALRTIGFMDRLVGELDKAIKVLAAPAHANRPAPVSVGGEFVLDDAEIAASARLMRVNHSGEVAAQALYQGQALTAREPRVAAAMRAAAAEEMDHLAWCEQRIRELNGRTSLLNPLWYLGSFAIGALAGAVGDKVSLGFVAETEKQVETHLRGHLDRLPAADERSRAIVSQMTHDEAAHGAQAASLGGGTLPAPLRLAMGLTSKLMTVGSYWV